MRPFQFQWMPPGPVATAFYNDFEGDFQNLGIMGPVGGGKTGTVVAKAIRATILQQPSLRDGVRRIKVCVVRDTYRRLWKTTLPSVWEWLPKNMAGTTFTGSEDSPAVQIVRWQVANPADVEKPFRYELQFDFVAIGDNAIEDVMRGYQPTFFWLNEADRLSPDVLTYLRGRAGRFPRMDDGGPTNAGVWMDYNAPDTENYLYKLFEEKKPRNHRLYRQPSGLSPHAENLKNLRAGYYEDQMDGAEDWYIRRMVRNEYGYSRDGEPVYGEKPAYQDQVHCAGHPLEPVRGLPLLIGVDAGRTPAAVFGQRLAGGEWQILRELALKGMGAKLFGKEVARDLAKHFKGWSTDLIEGWGDPAADHAGDQDERTWLQIVSEHSGIRFRAAPVPDNDLTVRLEAVRNTLGELGDKQPGFLISPECKVLRKGFNSGYRYKRIRTVGAEHRYDDKPEKNEYSHVHDALQYLLVGGGEHHLVLGRKRAQTNGVRQTRAATDDQEAQFAGGGGARQRVAID